MAIDKLARIQTKRIVVHQIFKRDDAGNAIPPVFNDKCETSNSGYSIIQERIVKSMGSKSHSIRMDIEDSSEESMFSRLCAYWKSEKTEEQFVEFSKDVTRMLSIAQNKRSHPGGIIICVEGTVHTVQKPFFCIIKAEKQDGFSLIRGADGMTLSYIDDIFMTKNEKFQKLGLFINNAVSGRNIEQKDVDCYIFDSNTNASISKAKAEYFYKAFLGLTFRRDSDVITDRFFQVTKQFIKGLDEINDVKKIELATALFTYINAEGTTIINPIDFAEENFTETSTLDRYTAYLTDRGVALESIHKDTSMIGNSLKVRSLFFSNNVKLQIPTEEFDEAVEITKDETTGETIIKIKGLMLGEK